MCPSRTVINSWGSSALVMFSSTVLESWKSKQTFFGIMPWLPATRRRITFRGSRGLSSLKPWMQAQARGEPYHGPVKTVSLAEALGPQAQNFLANSQAPTRRGPRGPNNQEIGSVRQRGYSLEGLSFAALWKQRSSS